MENIWNTLLKLKNLPYGSVHCVANLDLEQEVADMISAGAHSGCLNDADIHNRFLDRYRSWIATTELNQIRGLAQFPAAAFSNGTTEAFDKFYLKHSQKRLRYFRGEYMYHLVAANHYFRDHCYIDEDVLRPGDVVVFSLPFAGTGNQHEQTEEILTICDRLGIPVLIDCCYFGVCAGMDFNFDHDSIEAITFSLSKNFPVQHLRIGMRLSRQDDDDALFVYNKNRYVNRLGCYVGLALLDSYSADWNYEKYSTTQRSFADQLGVDASSCVFFATSEDKFSEYNRGTKENRLCFSRYLFSGQLPT
jgi:hypothetical protein